MSLDAAIRYDQPVELLPGVVRITQENPGLFSGPGTNTHVVGFDELYVLDPGEDRDDGHLERVLRAVDSRPVLGVLPSHGHPDHWPLSVPLADRLEAPVLFSRTDAPFRVDRVIADGEVLVSQGLRLEVLHTPGHAPDHLCWYWRERGVLFPGDHVMGWSTSIIAPPHGNLKEYMSSLERLLELPEVEVLLPAHGEAVDAPYERMEELLQHRLERSAQAVAALADGPAQIDELVARIYRDTDPRLHAAAARSLWAHLLALEEAGEVVRASSEDDQPSDRQQEPEAADDFEAVRRARWQLSS